MTDCPPCELPPEPQVPYLMHCAKCGRLMRYTSPGGVEHIVGPAKTTGVVWPEIDWQGLCTVRPMMGPAVLKEWKLAQALEHYREQIFQAYMIPREFFGYEQG